MFRSFAIRSFFIYFPSPLFVSFSELFVLWNSCSSVIYEKLKATQAILPTVFSSCLFPLAACLRHLTAINIGLAYTHVHAYAHSHTRRQMITQVLLSRTYLDAMLGSDPRRCHVRQTPKDATMPHLTRTLLPLLE